MAFKLGGNLMDFFLRELLREAYIFLHLPSLDSVEGGQIKTQKMLRDTISFILFYVISELGSELFIFYSILRF